MTELDPLMKAISTVVATGGIVFCAWVFNLYFTVLKMGLFKEFREAKGSVEIIIYSFLVLGTPVIFGYIVYNDLMLLWLTWS